MMRLAVDGLIAARDFGSIWAGISETGQRVRVRTSEPVWPVPGEVYEVQGEPVTYEDRFGRWHQQIDNARVTRVRASGRLLVPWLTKLPGVGDTRARRMLEAFGPDLLTVLDDPARLADLARALEPERPALGARLAAAVQAAYAAHAEKERDGIAEAAFYQRLEELGVEDRAAAASLWRLLGAGAWERLAERPYSTAAVLPWSAADHLGQRLLAAATGSLSVQDHPDRLAGAVDSAIRDILRDGDTAVTPTAFLRRLKGKQVHAERALAAGLDRGKVLLAGDQLLAPGAAWLESELLQELKRLRSATPAWHVAEDLRIERAVRNTEGRVGLTLTAEQRLAVCALLAQRVGLLQGGAGTGKTASMRVLVAAWKALGGSVEAVAIAGKAVLRLRRSTGLDALTVARLIDRLERREELEADGTIQPENDGHGSQRLPRFTARTLLLIDEASMVDLSSLLNVLRRLPTGASVLLVGDVAQLPPVRLGSVFSDLVQAGHGLVELKQVLRQAAGNPLLDVAAAIRDGHAPDLPAFNGPDLGVQHLECAAKDIPARMSELRTILSQDCDDLLLVAGRNTTVRTINRGEMARRHSEGAEGIPVGPLLPWVAVGDPVMMGANHYKYGLANGQLGRVTSVDPLTIHWDGEDRDSGVSDDFRHDILSAWAVTAHKAQGSDAARVVIALDSTRMTTRQWLYTAVTRAKEQAVFVGPRKMIDEAVERLAARCTGFSRLL